MFAVGKARGQALYIVSRRNRGLLAVVRWLCIFGSTFHKSFFRSRVCLRVEQLLRLARGPDHKSGSRAFAWVWVSASVLNSVPDL